MGWPHFGVVDTLSSAGIQLRGLPQCQQCRRLLGHESPRSLTSGAPLHCRLRSRKNTPTGFVAAFFAALTGFSLIWHIWWLVIVGLIGAYATFVVFAWRDESETEIPAEEVARIDRANREARGAALHRRQPA